MTQPIEQDEAVRAGQPQPPEQQNPAPEPASEKEDDKDDEEGKLDEAIEMTFPASDPISI